MTTVRPQRFPRLSSIDGVYRSVESFRERLEPTIDGPPPLPPLDAYLLHLVIEFCPSPAFVADLACDSTSGSSSVVCLANPLTSRVASATSDAPRRPSGAGIRSILEEFAAADLGQGRRLSTLPLASAESTWDSFRSSISPHEFPLFLVDSADILRADGLRIEGILDEFPGGLVVAFNVGNPGECDAAQHLVGACRNHTPYRLWLPSEISPSLSGCRSALIARRDHRSADSIVRRIDQVFLTNFDFLNLVRDSCMYAVEKGVTRTLDQEIAKLREDREHEIQRLAQELSRIGQDAGSLREQLDQELNRPIVKAFVLLTARRIVSFGRRQRRFFAPSNSLRERSLKALMRAQRRFRGKAA